MITKEAVLELLRPIMDPEIQIGIVDLGLIYDVSIGNEGKKVEVKMTLTALGCPYGPMLLAQVEDAIRLLPGVEETNVSLVWDPPWDPRTMASDEAKDQLMIW